MRQRPDPMIGGLVYETLSLVCAEFQIASVGGSSHRFTPVSLLVEFATFEFATCSLPHNRVRYLS